MENLKIPAIYKRCGIKVKCLKCKWQLGDGKCHEETDNTKSLSKCNHKDKHRFNLVVCVPNGGKTRRMKIIETRNFDAAFEEMKLFKQELKVSKYSKVKIKNMEINRTTLVSLAVCYLDSLSGVNTYKQLIRKISKEHVRETKRIIERFCIVLKKKGYNLEILELKNIGDAEVEIYHEHLLDELKLSTTTYNKHFVIMKAFINWCTKVKGYEMKNPFARAKLKFYKTEKTIIKKDEFEKLIKSITYENGNCFKHNKNRNYYRDWLPNAFNLALQTGTRAEELASLKWSSMIELENGIKVFRIQNFKVNRIQTGEDEGANIRYIPITKGLRDLLIELGLNEKEGRDEYIIEREQGHSTKYVMQLISRSFGHFITKASTRKIEFKDLRKTYITKLTMVLGDDAKMYTGHANNEIIKNHYLSGAYLAGNLKDFNVL